VHVLSSALTEHYAGAGESLERYSETCLRRVWRAQHFSWWMTSMLHRHDHGDPYEHKLQLAQLDLVASSRAQSQVLAENYVGMLERVMVNA
jgi:p-hydroxybenzoate 3-monooxygenase